MSNEEVTPERLAKLEERLERAERAICRLRRRIRNMAVIGVILFILMADKMNLAHRYALPVDVLNTRLAIVENKTGSISTLIDPNTGQPTVRFSHVNVQIVNGTEDTEQANGVGNLVVGYNEPRRDQRNNRTGSHNLIIGSGNNYSGIGGATLGFRNSTTGKYSSITGGFANQVTGDYASVTGGRSNIASGEAASISGGYVNRATQYGAHVSGGVGNQVNGIGSDIGGCTGVVIDHNAGCDWEMSRRK